MRYEFHPEAEAEFIEAAAYYERSVPGLGERFGAEVRGTLELLLQYLNLVCKLTRIYARSRCVVFHIT